MDHRLYTNFNIIKTRSHFQNIVAFFNPVTVESKFKQNIKDEKFAKRKPGIIFNMNIFEILSGVSIYSLLVLQ